jgi:hypothetical protein
VSIYEVQLAPVRHAPTDSDIPLRRESYENDHFFFDFLKHYKDFFAHQPNKVSITMLSFTVNTLFFAAFMSNVAANSVRSARQLSFAAIAGYEPRTSVTDHVSVTEFRIDLPMMFVVPKSQLLFIIILYASTECP